MIPPKGYRVNRAYASDRACPECGSMLVRLERPVVAVAARRLAPDDEEVSVIEGDGFKGTRRVTGWRHRATLRCPRCDRVLSPAQAVRRSFRDDELPADYLVRDAAADREAMWRALADSLRRRRAAPAEAPEPVQEALDLGGGGGDGAA